MLILAEWREGEEVAEGKLVVVTHFPVLEIHIRNIFVGEEEEREIIMKIGKEILVLIL